MAFALLYCTLLCLLALALALLSFVVVCLVFSFIFIAFCLLIYILYNLIWAQGFLELTFRMYTKPAFISVFSGFLSSSQNRQKSINPRIKIRTFENQMTSSLCLRQFFCLYVMIEKQPDTIKNIKDDEYVETKMSKMQDLKICLSQKSNKSYAEELNYQRSFFC